MARAWGIEPDEASAPDVRKLRILEELRDHAGHARSHQDHALRRNGRPARVLRGARVRLQRGPVCKSWEEIEKEEEYD
jgi:hypothetical protein